MNNLSIEQYIIAVILICGVLSNFFAPTSVIGKVLSIFGSLSVRSALATPAEAPKKESIVKVVTGLLCLMVFQSCLPAKKVWDTAYDTCVASLQIEPIVIQVAGKKAIPVLEYAKGICQVMVVLDPFVQELSTSKKLGAESATAKALKAAGEHGFLE